MGRKLSLFLYPDDIVLISIPGPNQSVYDPSGCIDGKNYTLQVTSDRECKLRFGIHSAGVYEGLNTADDYKKLKGILNGETDKT